MRIEHPLVHCGDNHCDDDLEDTLFSWLLFTPVLLLWDMSTLRIVDHLWPLTLRSLLRYLSTLWFISTRNVQPYIMCLSAEHIVRRVHCLHDYIYISLILLLWDLTNLRVEVHLWALVLRSLLNFLSTIWFICTSNMKRYIMCSIACVAT